MLLISDDPSNRSFRPIMILKTDIEKIIRKKVDMLTITHSGIIFNQKQINVNVNTDIIFSTFKDIIKKDIYDICIISLELRNLNKIFTKETNIIELLRKNSPKTSIFIFGGKSILKTLEKTYNENIFYSYRLGVAKITNNFKNVIIDYINNLVIDR